MTRATIVAIIGVLLFIIILGAGVAIKRAELALVVSSGGSAPITSCFPASGDSAPPKLVVLLSGRQFTLRPGPGGTWESGSITGPGDHNGTFSQKLVKVKEEERHEHPPVSPSPQPPPPPPPTAPEVTVKIGDNDTHDNDLNIRLTFLAGNKVHIVGKIGDKDVDVTVTKTHTYVGHGTFRNNITVNGEPISWNFPS